MNPDHSINDLSSFKTFPLPRDTLASDQNDGLSQSAINDPDSSASLSYNTLGSPCSYSPPEDSLNPMTILKEPIGPLVPLAI